MKYADLRAENARLRAAVREYVDAQEAYDEWMVFPVRPDWTSGEARAREQRLDAAQARLRRLAALEGQEQT